MRVLAAITLLLAAGIEQAPASLGPPVEFHRGSGAPLEQEPLLPSTTGDEYTDAGADSHDGGKIVVVSASHNHTTKSHKEKEIRHDNHDAGFHEVKEDSHHNDEGSYEEKKASHHHNDEGSKSFPDQKPRRNAQSEEYDEKHPDDHKQSTYNGHLRESGNRTGEAEDHEVPYDVYEELLIGYEGKADEDSGEHTDESFVDFGRFQREAVKRGSIGGEWMKVAEWTHFPDRRHR